MTAQSQDQDGAKLILSVAMCTYNGELYLQEQLTSIAKQTRLPDELIVCDDGSTDCTLDILKEFRDTAPFPVRIQRNERRLGPTKNFEKCVMMCTGGLIALSDQDDVWMPHKLERLEKALESHPEAGYVFSDALVVNEKLHPLGYTMWAQVSFTVRQRRRFEQGHQLEVLLKHNVVTGATMAFRAELCGWILPIPDQWVHDAWIALLASAAGVRGIFIREPFIKYRQHLQQLIGGLELSFHEQIHRARSTKGDAYAYAQTEFLQVLDRLVSAEKGDKNAQELVEAKVQHLIAREAAYKGTVLKRSKSVLQELLAGRYHKFSNGWRSTAKDLLIAIAQRGLQGEQHEQ
jgi:glycosyltransferase involved in cell wall biosynthesis